MAYKETTTDATQLGMLLSTFLSTVRRLQKKAEAIDCSVSAEIEFQSPLAKSDLSINMRLYRHDASGEIQTLVGPDYYHQDFSLEYLSERASLIENVLNDRTARASAREEEIDRQMEALRREKRDIQRKRKKLSKTNGNVEH